MHHSVLTLISHEGHANDSAGTSAETSQLPDHSQGSTDGCGGPDAEGLAQQPPWSQPAASHAHAYCGKLNMLTEEAQSPTPTYRGTEQCTQVLEPGR